MKDFLSASQRSCLKLAHRMERDRKIGDRMKVVLLADQGESFAEIAKFLFIDEQTARRHLRDYFDNDKTGGSSGGTEGKLTQEQAARLRAILATCDVPTAQTAVEKVKGLFSVKFSISGMTHWLNRNRFSFKKSEPAPAKADPLAQAEFIDTYRCLKDDLPEGEVVLFLDAAHPTMATKLGYGWSLKGERKIVGPHHRTAVDTCSTKRVCFFQATKWLFVREVGHIKKSMLTILEFQLQHVTRFGIDFYDIKQQVGVPFYFGVTFTNVGVFYMRRVLSCYCYDRHTL